MESVVSTAPSAALRQKICVANALHERLDHSTIKQMEQWKVQSALSKPSSRPTEMKEIAMPDVVGDKSENKDGDNEKPTLKPDVGEVLELDVGGQSITTLRSTLTRFEDSMLGSMFSGRFAQPTNRAGRVVLDADPEIFRLILQWLRRDRPPHVPDHLKQAFRDELDYFGLSEYFPLNTLEPVIEKNEKSDGVKIDACFEIQQIGPASAHRPESFRACWNQGNLPAGSAWVDEFGFVVVSFESEVALKSASWCTTPAATWALKSPRVSHVAMEYDDDNAWKLVGNTKIVDCQEGYEEKHVLSWRQSEDSTQQQQGRRRWRLRVPSILGVYRLCFYAK